MFGRTERYTIYDQGDMRHVLDRLLSAPPAGVQRALCDHGQPGIAEVLFELSRAKNLLLSPESYERSASHPGAPLIAALWRESEEELRRSDAMDFDDLLAFGVRLLADDPHRLQVASPALALDPGRRVPGHKPRPGDAGRLCSLARTGICAWSAMTTS